MKNSVFPAIERQSCRRTRLAEGELAAVDRCGCGMFQLHLAAVTLRLAPEALASLYATLGRALSVSAAAERARGDARGGATFEANAERWSES
jgi:hypothetical protein